MEVTARQRSVVVAYLAAGSRTGAARRLGLSTQAVDRHLEAVRRRLDVETTAQAVGVLAARGELDVPDLR